LPPAIKHHNHPKAVLPKVASEVQNPNRIVPCYGLTSMKRLMPPGHPTRETTYPDSEAREQRIRPGRRKHMWPKALQEPHI